MVQGLAPLSGGRDADLEGALDQVLSHIFVEAAGTELVRIARDEPDDPHYHYYYGCAELAGVESAEAPDLAIESAFDAFKQASLKARSRHFQDRIGRTLNYVRSILAGEKPGKVADQYHGAWYRELFAPSVNAGIIEPAHLAGYRSEQVFIRNSMHVPFNPKSIREAVPTFFELVSEEDDEFARIVLGHFMFVYIHPYMDGNGRMGRFLMNVMMAAAGLPWVIIPIEQRTPYMEALEEASVNENIVPFAKFLHSLM